MVTLLITSSLVLGLLIVALYYWQKPNSKGDSNLLPPTGQPRGLFSVEESSSFLESASSHQEKRATILEQAARDSKQALHDALQLNDRHFYDQVLDLLTKSADTEPKLLSLVSFITRAELPVNSGVAQAVFESWQRSPDRSSTVKTLHIVALANDASLYNDTVLAAMEFWREGRLPDISPQELRSLFEGEFWLLSSKVRSSGEGFILKRTLAKVRKEFAATSSD